MLADLPPAPPITVRIREACRLTGIGRSKLYMLIGEGYIETVKVGSMTLVTMRSLEAFLLGPQASRGPTVGMDRHPALTGLDADFERKMPEF